MTTFRDRLKSRFGVFGLLVLVILGVLLVRLWTMQVLAGASYAAQSTDNRIRQIAIDPPRGRIFDRNGKPLVTNRPSLAVMIEPQASEDTTLMARVGQVIGMKPGDIRHAVDSSRLAPLRARMVKLDISMVTASYLAERSPAFPGVSVETVPMREYPSERLATHVLGYVGQISEDEIAKRSAGGDYRLGDVVGKTGAEAEFEKVLRGERGFRTVEVDAQGRLRRIVNQRDPVSGHDVVLTIDSGLQAVTEQALKDAIQEAHRQKFPKANAGAAVVLDVTSGEVLAMASYPDYDPSQFLSGISASQWRSLTETASAYPLNDRVIMSAYPPASTFKAVTGLAGLQARITRATTTFDCGGRWIGLGPQWGKWCWNHAGHGTIAFVDGIARSCDTVFYNLGAAFYRMPNQPLQVFARACGFGARSGIDLPGEVTGRVPTPEWKQKYNKFFPENQNWQPGDTVNMAIGQGDMLTTPLQLCDAYAGIANNGAIMQPHVLKQVLGPDGKAALVAKPRVQATMPVSAANLAVVQGALRDVVSVGTARSTFRGFRTQVSGKTGTAQVAGKDDYAWFVGYCPSEDPRYAVAVLIEQGGHGASIAGPAARMIMAKLTDQPVAFVRGGKDVSR